MNSNLQKIVEKVTSRKFIVSLIGVVIGVATAAGIDPEEYAGTASQIAALIGQIAGIAAALTSGVTYVRSETAVDVERISASRKINVGFPEEYADDLKDALTDDSGTEEGTAEK